jgi:arginase
METNGISTWKFFDKREIGVTCVAFSGGQPREGVDLGPEYVLKAGLIRQLNEMDFNVVLTGDKIHTYREFFPESDPPIGIIKRPRTVGIVNKIIRDQIYHHVKMGRLALQIGGDHSMALGTISGVAKGIKERLGQDIKVIWVDAHADINTPETTETGNLHGMPVSFLMNLVKTKVEGLDWIEPCLKPENLVYIGLRDVDKDEKEILKKYKIKAFSMHEIDRYGIGQVMDMTLEHLSKGDNPKSPIHLSFDIDALDPSVASSTGTPVRGGLTFREGHYICEALHATGRLVALDMVELNPAIGDNHEDTITVGCSLIRATFGEALL